MSAWKIGRLFGIDVKVHWSFLLLPAWVAYEHLRQGQTGTEAAIGVAFILCIFGCVLLHEFGHALTARRYGVGTRDITMLPIGGVARLNSIPRDPWQELMVALAGPAVNVVIAAVIAAGLYLNGGLESLMPMEASVGELAEGSVSKKDFVVRDTGDFLRLLMGLNIFLVIFNMLPAFPMDGGRVLRALLAFMVDYRPATRWAAAVGKLCAIGFGLLFFFGDDLSRAAWGVELFGRRPWLLLLIAVFVWYGAGSENREVHVRELLSGVHVGQMMLTRFHAVDPTETLDVVAARLIGGGQQDYPVVGIDGLPIGVLTRKDLLRAIRADGFNAAVADAMEPSVEPLPPTAAGVSAYRRLRQGGVLPVVDGPDLVGIVTQESLRNYLMLREAFEGRDGVPMPIPGSELVV